jgi:tetratricopeptide (TPR) repeat protein
MRFFHAIPVLAAFLVASPAHRGQPAVAPPPSSRPDRPSPAEPADGASIVAEIRNLAGTVECDETRPGRPVVTVRITGFRATDAVLAHLAKLTTLQDLAVTNCNVTDAGLETLAGFAKLEALSLLACKQISDDGLKHLQGLKNLQELDLNSTSIGDAGLQHLKGLARLRVLHLFNTKVSDAGLQTIQAFTDLRELGLANTGITDAGLEDLKTLTRLQKLTLSGKNSNSAVNSLRQTLPKTFIIHHAEGHALDWREYQRRAAIWEKIKSAARLAAEAADREAAGQQAADQKKKALAIVDEVAAQEDIEVRAGFAAAEIAFLLGANQKAIAVMEKLVRLRPKDQAPGIVAPVDETGTFCIGTYARYGNDPKRAVAAYTSLLDMARENPTVYSGVEICFLHLAEIEAHFNHDPQKAVAWLDRILQVRPPRPTPGMSGGDPAARGWKMCQDLARHEIAVLQGKQPDWQAPSGDDVFMMSVGLLCNGGMLDLAGLAWGDERPARKSPDYLRLVQLAARSDVSRLDRALVQYLLGMSAVQANAFAEAEPHFRDLLASDSFFAPAGGIALARCQMKEGKPDEARETLRKLTARFPSLKTSFEAVTP